MVPSPWGLKPNAPIPAARAASIPSGVSSTTAQSLGATPIAFAACRKRSGAGFPRSTSAALNILPSNLSKRPAAPSVIRIFSSGPLEATQTATVTRSSASATPVTGSTPAASAAFWRSR